MLKQEKCILLNKQMRFLSWRPEHPWISFFVIGIKRMLNYLGHTDIRLSKCQSGTSKYVRF